MIEQEYERTRKERIPKHGFGPSILQKSCGKKLRVITLVDILPKDVDQVFLSISLFRELQYLFPVIIIRHRKNLSSVLHLSVILSQYHQP
jgi:hypothetical protein